MTNPRALRLLAVVLGVLFSGCAGRLDPHALRPFDKYNYDVDYTTDPGLVNDANWKCSAAWRPGDQECSLTGKYILIHADGYAVTPDNEPAKPRQFTNQLERITAGLRHHARALPSGCDTLKILLFVHGGLNGHDAGVTRMTEWVPNNQFFSRSCYYPIFVNWNSAIGSSVWDDLVGLRFGQRPKYWYETVYGWVTAPVVLLSRLASAMGNLPIAMGHSVYNTVGGIKAAWDEDNVENREGHRWWTLLDAGIYQSLLPLQLVTTPLLEGFGTPAWQVMKRRANLAVAPRLPTDVGIFESYKSARKGPGEPGAAWRLLAELRKTIGLLRAEHRDVSITLVGHSMGAMLLDRLIAISGDDLPVSDIVYLAPAASIDDVIHSVLSYLHRQEVRRCLQEDQLDRLTAVESAVARLVTDPARAADQAQAMEAALRALAAARVRVGEKITQTRLWIFTLNARDEAREVAHPYEWLLWAFPRGSLLQWIDGYFEPNTTRGQTTAGKELNIVAYHDESPANLACGNGRIVPGPGEAPAPPPSDNGTGIGDFKRVQISAPGIRDNRVLIYHATRRTNRLFGDHGLYTRYTNAPGEHGDFTDTRFIGQVLCRVDLTAFPNDYCARQVPDLKPPDELVPPLHPSRTAKE